jgi:hypothetical protein
LIQRQDWQPRSLAEWGEEFSYRAAILEYEGGFTRSEAEARALKIVGPYSREMDRKNRNNPRQP